LRIALILWVFLVAAGGQAFAYSVSGIVDFSYTAYRSKIGNVTSSYQQFTEHIGANLSSFVYDPRVLNFNAGVGYAVIYNDKYPDSSTLTYDLGLNFFPGRMISGELRGSKSVAQIESATNIAGYKLDTLGYGGALNLRLSMLRNGFGNNNRNLNRNNNSNSNSNSNNNGNGVNGNYGRRYLPPLPDIYLTYQHNEAVSDNAAFAQNESRDDSGVYVTYRLNSFLDFLYDMKREKFTNHRNGSGYDSTTQLLEANARVASNGTLRIYDKVFDRLYHEAVVLPGPTLAYRDRQERTSTLSGILDFTPVKRLAHSYLYSFDSIEGSGTVYRSNRASARMSYFYLPELAFNGSGNYFNNDLNQSAVGLQGPSKSQVTSTALEAGIQYGKTFNPELLDPFALLTGYRYDLGYADVNDVTTGRTDPGWYYVNTFNLGLHSTRWRQENLNFDMSYMSRRDYTLLENDAMAQSYNMTFLTSRVPRTSINAYANYTFNEVHTGSIPAAAGIVSPIGADQTSHGRSLSYNLTVDHAATSYLGLNAGATRNKTKTTTDYSLASVSSSIDYIERVWYVGATLSYKLSRNFLLRSQVRHEVYDYTTENNVDRTSNLFLVGFDYQIRKLVLTGDYRWREDIRKVLPRVEQQSLYLKLMRPF